MRGLTAEEQEEVQSVIEELLEEKHGKHNVPLT